MNGSCLVAEIFSRADFLCFICIGESLFIFEAMVLLLSPLSEGLVRVVAISISKSRYQSSRVGSIANIKHK